MKEQKELYLDLLKESLTASIYDESAWGVVQPADVLPKTIREPINYARGIARWLVFKWLERSNLSVISRRRFDRATREEGKDWPCFGYSMVGLKRLNNVQACVEDVLRNDIPGDLVETGVWRGGTTIFMAALLKLEGADDRKVWAADSFEGLPVPESDADGADLSQVDYLKVSLEQVKANFARFDLLSDQVKFLKGWFCDTLPTAPIERIAVLRLDGDLYHSTMDALRSLYHKVSPGGYVIIDDYASWESCKAAVTDFLAENGLEPQIQMIDSSAAYWKVEEQFQPIEELDSDELAVALA